MLHLNGFDLTGVALLERKAVLSQVMASLPKAQLGVVRVSDYTLGDGPQFFERACRLGLEGVVSKRAQSPYRAGRTRDWVKVKCVQRQEFIVVGYTDPGGSRAYLGALLLAVRRNKALVYCGRVGTGFTERSLKDLKEKLSAIPRPQPELDNPPRGAQAKDVHWVAPELVAEVAFTGFTQDGLLRHPTFQGLREDKPATKVRLEKPKPLSPRATTTMGQLQFKPAGAHRGSLADYPLTHPDKLLFPEVGITKQQLLDYYALVADRMLPHVVNRPLTLVRCPNGWNKPCFFQKHLTDAATHALRPLPIREARGEATYAVLNDRTALYALVQLGVLELHTWGSRADDIEHPNLLVFDLDPDPDLDYRVVIACAQRLRAMFESVKLESFVKTTGGKGLHVCVPMEPELDFAQAKDFSQRLAQELVREAPELYIANQSKSRRKGKIYIDYLRNARGATFIAPYSTRARKNAPVATPLEWDELHPKLQPNHFTVKNIAERLRNSHVCPWERMTKLRQRLSCT